jgi:hypothetical protein
MGKAKEIEMPPSEPAPGEFGPLTPEQFRALPEDVRQRRGQRILAKFKELQGKVHLNIDIDELRGRNRC